MPVVPQRSITPVEMLPGVFRRTMTDGQSMMLCEVSMRKGAIVPMHTHPHEQTGYLVSGRARMQIEDKAVDLVPGDCWMVPGNVPHEATALEDAVFIDIFSPPREEYRV